MIDCNRQIKVSRAVHLLVEATRSSVSQKRQLQLPAHSFEAISLLISTVLDIKWLNQSAYTQILAYCYRREPFLGRW
jgi:SOS response regulatory protein OraA/RecX